MKKKLILIIFSFFAIISFADAQSLYNGYTTPLGYVYNNGYFWLSGKPYTRAVYQVSGHWSNGCYVSGYSEYRYSLAVIYTPPAAPIINNAVATNTNDWRVQLLKVAEQRDKLNSDVIKSNLEHAQYM